MKQNLYKLILVLGLGFAATIVPAGEIKSGPRGGRMLEKTSPSIEFFVENDRTVSLTFYDEAGKPVAVKDQSAKVTAQLESGKTTIELEKKNGLLVSTRPLPEGEPYTIVVQIRSAADEKPRNFRIQLDTSICDGCNRAEYACDCHQ